MENEYIDVSGGFELPTKEEYKFIKLFEEYLVKYNSEYGTINCSINIPGITLMGIHESVIISKQFGFIERLVKEDKIDRERINDRWGDMSIHFTDEELFIMSLSTSNTPIKDLISYLKE